MKANKTTENKPDLNAGLQLEVINQKLCFENRDGYHVDVYNLPAAMLLAIEHAVKFYLSIYNLEPVKRNGGQMDEIDRVNSEAKTFFNVLIEQINVRMEHTELYTLYNVPCFNGLMLIHALRIYIDNSHLDIYFNGVPPELVPRYRKAVINQLTAFIEASAKIEWI